MRRDSFTIFVRDANGETFLHMTATNWPGEIAAAKAHRRAWLAETRRLSRQGKYKFRQPVGRCEIVVEEF